MGTPIKKGAAPTLVESDTWFNGTIIPKRTAAAGFSGKRLWKSPRALVKGNTEDPDGLCGDAAAYVCVLDRVRRLHHKRRIPHRSGSVAGRIHEPYGECNVGPDPRSRFSNYSWDAKKRAIVLVSRKAQYGTTELLTLHVYDLYYKKKATTLEMWWKGRDSDQDGTIKLGFPYSIED
jgi:hypothetical protein